jgi:hypothetical protein
LIICQDVHTFGYLARSNYPPNAKSVGLFVLSLGWVIEGRAGDQLPEQLLGSLRVMRVNPTTQHFAGKPDHVLELNTVRDGVETFGVAQDNWIHQGMHMR